MAWQIKPRRRHYALGSLCLLIVLSSLWWWLRIQRPPLVLAPMMDLTACLLAQPSAAPNALPDWLGPCTGPRGSAAHLVESTLRHLQPTTPDTTEWRLGYTLQVPLLALLQADQKNIWHVNDQALEKIVRTVSESPRPSHSHLAAPVLRPAVLSIRC